MNALLEPGVIVRHPDRPHWGSGQVQSVDGERVTVNFSEVGKRTLDARVVPLVIEATDPALGAGRADAD